MQHLFGELGLTRNSVTPRPARERGAGEEDGDWQVVQGARLSGERCIVFGNVSFYAQLDRQPAMLLKPGPGNNQKWVITDVE